MKYAIHINALSSIYQDSTDKSKMTSQLLFGELCLIKSERDDFFYIENYYDKHSGWVLKNVLEPISEKEVKSIKEQPLMRVCMPLVEMFNTTERNIQRVPAGSVIPNYNPDNSSFSIAEVGYQIHSSFVTHLPHGNIDGIADVALAFLNAPFAFGGKTVLGVDKAGFVQLVFALCGYSIPRNLQDQVKVGVPVYSVEQLRKGDLIFIENKNVIENVLIFLGDNKAVEVGSKVVLIDLSSSKIDLSSCVIRRLV